MFERGERPADRILGPALRIGLYRIVEAAVERSQQIWSQGLHIQVADQIGRLGYDEIVLVSERFAQGRDAGFVRLVAEQLQSGELLP